MKNREQITNPFYFRGPMNPDDESCSSTMVMRDDILEGLLEDVSKVQYSLILGPRQMGKTTVAYQLSSRLRGNSRNIVCFIECGILGGATEDNVVDLIYSKVFQKYKQKASEAGNEELFAHLDFIDRYPKPKTFYELSTFLEVVLTNAPGMRRIVLVLDEVEAIPRPEQTNLLSMFRAIFNLYRDRREDPKYCVIMVTTKNLAAVDIGFSSPYNIAEIRDVRNFSPEQVREMLDQNHIGEQISRVFADEAIELLINESGGHPYLVQRICSRAVRWYIEGKVNRIDKDCIIESILHMFEYSDRNLRITLGKAAEVTEDELLCKKLLCGRRIPFERVLPTINRLYEAGVIRKASEERRICAFGNRIYERLLLNRYFDEVVGLEGIYLKWDATLFIRSSEIQRIIFNEEIRKHLEHQYNLKRNELKNNHDLLKLLLDEINELYKKAYFDYDVNMIEQGLLFFGSKIPEGYCFTESSMLEVLASLYLELFASAGDDGSKI